MNVLCSEPSPTSPAEKFFDSQSDEHLAPETEAILTTDISNNNEIKSVFVSPLSDSSGYESNLSISSAYREEFVDGEEEVEEEEQCEDADELNFLFDHKDSPSPINNSSIPAIEDAHILADDRVIHNLLAIESYYVPHLDFSQSTNNAIDQTSRRILVEWLCEVCIVIIV